MKARVNLREESGSALVAGIIILFIILGFGLAVLSTADTQSHQTGKEASGEAAFNLAEGALDSEADLLQQSWPSAATSTCDQSTAASTYCPGSAITNAFNTTYAGKWFTNPTWSVQLVDDNGGNCSTTTCDTTKETSNYYTDSFRSASYSYDQNKDDMIWIRAQANVGGQQRIVVAEMIRTKQVISLPKNVITAGGTYTSNDGNKVIINANDNAYGGSGAGPLNIRCTVPTTGGVTAPTYGNQCAGWDPSKGQLSPSGDYTGNYTDPNGGGSPVDQNILNELKYTAQSAGTYYTSCPPNDGAHLNGIIYVDLPTPTSSCTYTQGSFNGPWTSTGCPASAPTPCPATNATPGAIIFGQGTLEINGPVDYYGIIFIVNPSSPAMVGGVCTSFDGPEFWVHGGANIFGGIFVNGCGTVNAGDSAANVDFDSAAFAGFSAYPTPELAKNTFRVISN
jgi:Tfp pilus assembly protein PilX